MLETTETLMGGGSHIHRRISWAAIFGGVIMVVVIQLLLSMLGAGIGLGTVNVNAGSTPDASSFGIGAGLWWVISSCIALMAGGYVAAWFAGIEVRFDGVLHGLVTWGIATILTLYLLSSAIGGIIGGGFSALGNVASAAGSGVQAAAQPLAEAAGVSPDMIQQQAQAYLQPASPDPAKLSPQEAQKEIARNLVIYAKGGSDAEGAKSRMIAIKAAKDAADASAAAASKTSFAAFGNLLLGAIAAAIGGSLAVQRRLQITQRVVR